MALCNRRRGGRSAAVAVHPVGEVLPPGAAAANGLAEVHDPVSGCTRRCGARSTRVEAV